MELCFFSNLSSSEWASWVQAIGSLAALAIAIVVGNRAIAHDRLVRRESQNDKEASDLNLVILSMMTAQDMLKGYYVYILEPWGGDPLRRFKVPGQGLLKMPTINYESVVFLGTKGRSDLLMKIRDTSLAVEQAKHQVQVRASLVLEVLHPKVQSIHEIDGVMPVFEEWSSIVGPVEDRKVGHITDAVYGCLENSLKLLDENLRVLEGVARNIFPTYSFVAR
jgi:hypothetical protein